MRFKTRIPWFVGSVTVWLMVCLLTAHGQAVAPKQKLPDALTAAEFSRLSREFSEEGGFFPSDNFTSNETSFLTIVEKLREVGTTGGAYIGVGPEQNFTYIAKVRPRIAFIVDIRRQAVIQHLMFKALFHLAPTRAQFLSLLMSKPLPKGQSPAADAAIGDLVKLFSDIAGDEKAYAENLTAVKKAIQTEFQYPLSEDDLKSLDYVYKSFLTDGLEIGFRMRRRDGNGGAPPGGGFPGNGGFRGGGGRFPVLKDLLTQLGSNGKPGMFLANADDYEFVRGLHRKNLIIPVVGDFAGKKALAAVADYLRQRDVTVSAFYTSNVEMVLFQNGIFDGYGENVKKLPVNDKSLIIRAAFSRYSHPARLEGHSTFTLMQKIPVFTASFTEGRYQSYTDIINSNYIAADKQ